MRVRKLDLTRYGMFTDYPIDFGESDPNQPDLHIIYGPNEAGKSTALSAYLDILFGIKKQSQYGFRHGYDTMQIGAHLEFGSKTQELIRTKNQGLLGQDGNSIAEGILTTFLGGIDRDSYRSMFSLDDDTLESGGEDILQSKGDIGQLLFSATTGLANLNRVLEKLREDADSIYKPRAHKTEIAALKKRLEELKSEKSSLDTGKSAYDKMIKDRDCAKVSYDKTSQDHAKTITRLKRVDDILRAIPDHQALLRVRTDLDEFGELPEPPNQWLDEIPSLMSQEVELSTKHNIAKKETQRIKGDLDNLPIDSTVLRLESRISLLNKSQARYVTAVEDIPRRQSDLSKIDKKISGILSRLGNEENEAPESLVLSAGTVGTLEDLIEKRSGIEEKLEAAKKEHSEAKENLTEAQAELADVQDSSNDSNGVRAIETLIATVRKSDHETRRQLAIKEQGKKLRSLSDQLAKLLPWKGGVKLLAEILVPEMAQVLNWKTKIDASENELRQHEDTVKRLTAKQKRCEAEIEALKASDDAIDDELASTVRTARNKSWNQHLENLDGETAGTFEKAMKADDDVTDSRLRRSEDIARLRQLKQTLAGEEADLESAVSHRDAALSNLQTMQEKVQKAILEMIVPGASSLPKEFTPIQLESWLDWRGKALEMQSRIREDEADITAAESDCSEHHKKIAEALTAGKISFDPDANLNSLLDIAQSAIDRAKTNGVARRGAEGTVKNCDRVLKRRIGSLKEAQKITETWEADWNNSIADCWLSEDQRFQKPAIVRKILSENSLLISAIGKQEGFTHRVEEMEADQKSFAEEVSVIASELSMELDKNEPLNTADAIRDRLEIARWGKRARTEKLEELETAKNRNREITEQMAVDAALIKEMVDFFGLEKISELNRKRDDVIRRTELRTRRDDLESRILEGLKLATITEADTMLAEVDREALEVERAELETRSTDQEQCSHELYAEHEKLKHEVNSVGGDDAAARIEEKRQTTFLELEEKALKYLRIKVGAEATERALRLYRDKHQSSMMSQASKAFRTISRQNYSSLSTQPDRNRDVLIGVGADGSSKIASQLSKGTRFQLYLALRVAGYYEFVRSREPLPFIADDIMETFDDFRAEEAFKLFAGMAEVGQVIYLTHHRHLCAIAKKTCPGVMIHELPNPTSGVADVRSR